MLELTGSNDQLIKEYAQNLLKKLIILSYNILPDSQSNVDFLLSSLNQDMQLV